MQKFKAYGVAFLKSGNKQSLKTLQLHFSILHLNSVSENTTYKLSHFLQLDIKFCDVPHQIATIMKFLGMCQF